MLILRSRTATFKFDHADGSTTDPGGNIVVKELVETIDEDGKKAKEMQILAIVSPAEFLYLYHTEGVTLTEVPGAGQPRS